MKYLKRFETEHEYNSYVEGDSLILPNVSFITELSSTGGIKFNPLPDPDNPFNGHEYVDLGLPSGTLWAKCNIGAEKESDYGLYFQWGDVVGYSKDQVGSGEGKKYFDWSNYKYCNGSSTTLTKYCTSSSYGIVDDLTTLEFSDDAASVNMGGSWRMPSKEEYKELIDNTTNTWTTVNGVNGRLFTGNNGNTLFFPASGVGRNGYVSLVGSHSSYWGSSLIPNRSNYSCVFYFNSSSCSMSNDYRCCGYTVRGVIG